MNEIDVEVLRLIEEIAKHEKDYTSYADSAMGAFSDRTRESYLIRAQAQLESIQRKTELLAILKR